MFVRRTSGVGHMERAPQFGRGTVVGGDSSHRHVSSPRPLGEIREGHHTYPHLRRTFRLGGGATPVYQMPAAFSSGHDEDEINQMCGKMPRLTLTREGRP